ncbi:pyrroline carboxylate reductase [Piedraia hortae CBS 480.64]|uniref:Pyrroline-5-carboxylate reductase n=1 Tax=Piedraia hortae CBS 480.64 TaxID=1314780 RepID=A0A6A7C4C0_9PEZI|nr:pyrroline carboxylate reductase [Piedraia hortae CBS 480.64]
MDSNTNSSDSIHTHNPTGNESTLTVLGCGTMGIAILRGLLSSSDAGIPARNDSALPIPTRFHACVPSARGAGRIKTELGTLASGVTVHVGDILPALRAANVVLLCVKPYAVEKVLSGDGIGEALRGKLLVSICAGITEGTIRGFLDGGCRVVRVMPNTAAAVRESMSVVSIENGEGKGGTAVTTTDRAVVEYIFSKIGRVVSLPASCMDACTALCGSGPAFVALLVESMAAGAIAMGVPREEAYIMATQTMRGTTALLLEGKEHPAVLRDKVCTPGGCTIGGLLVLEEGNVRGAVARAVREAACVAGQLGEGRKGVNGTR